MSPTVANFVFEAANFLLLAATLGWLLFKPVRRALDAERERHAKEAEEGRRLRAEAETLAGQAKAEQEAAERGAAERRAEALAEARREADKLLEEARKARAQERQRLDDELRATRAAQAEALAGAVGRIAAETVRSLLVSLEGPALDAALVRAACSRLSELPVAARASAQVEVARPLDAEATDLLAGALGRVLEARVVPELGAGVRVTTAAGQIDATAAGLAREAAKIVGHSEVPLA